MTRITQRAVPTPEYPPGWLVGQLPVGMRDDDLLVRFTTLFERVGATLRAGTDGIEHVADPSVTAPGMLAYLGRWLGYDLLAPHLPIGQQRRIVAALGRALPLRGTARGLRILLEAITDGPVEVVDPGAVIGDDASVVYGDGTDLLDGDGASLVTNDGSRPSVPSPVEVRVGGTGHLREHELARFVRDEVPAHLQVSLVVDPTLGSTDTAGPPAETAPS